MDEKDRSKYSHFERVVHNVLKKYFYTNGNIETITDKQMQMDGLDCIYQGRWFIDEKCNVTRVNGGLKCFCLEMTSRSKETNKRINGWFLKEKNLNNMYVFVWLSKVKKSAIEQDKLGFFRLKETVREEDIEEIEVAAITKNDLFAYLQANGYPTKQSLRDRAFSLKENRVVEGDLVWLNENYSHGVLLQIPKEVLLSMSLRKKVRYSTILSSN